MTPSDLDPILHDHAARWRERPPELTMPQLTPSAAISPTRGRGYLALAGGIVTVLLVAAVLLFITGLPGHTSTTSSPSDTATSSGDTTVSVGDTIATLTRIAVRTAQQNGDPDVTAQAVKTTYRRAERVVLDGDTSSEPPPDSAVWVVQILGDFTCESCNYPAGASAPKGRVITLVLAGAHLTRTDFAITKHTHHLTRLGTVIDLHPTSSHSAPFSSSPSDHPSSHGPWYGSSESAIKTTCHAFWVGRFIQGTAETEQQWETKGEYNSGTGQVAKLKRSTQGFRVADCHAGGYTHG